MAYFRRVDQSFGVKSNGSLEMSNWFDCQGNGVRESLWMRDVWRIRWLINDDGAKVKRDGRLAAEEMTHTLGKEDSLLANWILIATHSNGRNGAITGSFYLPAHGQNGGQKRGGKGGIGGCQWCITCSNWKSNYSSASTQPCVGCSIVCASLSCSSKRGRKLHQI